MLHFDNESHQYKLSVSHHASAREFNRLHTILNNHAIDHDLDSTLLVDARSVYVINSELRPIGVHVYDSTKTWKYQEFLTN